MQIRKMEMHIFKYSNDFIIISCPKKLKSVFSDRDKEIYFFPARCMFMLLHLPDNWWAKQYHYDRKHYSLE